MVDSTNFFKDVKKHPDWFFIIHYSSQGLFDEQEGVYSPRITSIVVMHYATKQTVSFSLHTVAESMHISKEELETKYDEVEKELLTRFYEFVRDRREKFWIHWNMKNVTFGFEHLAHRHLTLTGVEPPHIPVEVRLDLSDALKNLFGNDFADAPRMKNLMLLQGPLDVRFLVGAQEAQCFKDKEFIRMNNSTISKVEFFRYVIGLVLRGKLRTAGRGIGERIDRLLETRSSRVTLLLAAIVGVGVGLYQCFLWWHGKS